MTRLFAFSLVMFCFSVVNAQVDPLKIDIVRDKFGVPHIYGATDADAAYGLAWASCEDDFKTLQEIALAVRGKLGEVQGKNGAILDFMAFICQADEVVEARYDTSFSPAYLKVMNAYVDGVNAYAAAHPDEVLRPGLFPLTGKDFIKGYVLTNTFLTSAYIDILKIFQGTMKNYEGNVASGSNAFAFKTTKTTDGKTYLAVNSHQPLEGLFSWYEVHINSNEGMNMLGGTFVGGASVFLGTNNKLGWACTLNHPDLVDTYKLTMNPDNKLQYKYDGKWENLEVLKKKVKVKVGFMRIPVTKTFYRSKYGITLKNKDGFYSVRFPANMEIRTPEQMYWMNKAQNFDQWYKAMDMKTIPGMNIVYADRDDNIFYISTGHLPYRNPNYNWLRVLPGDTSATLWEAGKYYPLEKQPHYLNPSCGYLFNTNSTCFDATGKECNLLQKDYDPTMGFLMEKNNRSIRAQYLISQYDKVSYQDFKTIKYDEGVDTAMYNYNCEGMKTLVSLDIKKYPDLADAMAVLKDWNYKTDVNNKEAALMVFAVKYLSDQIVAQATMYEYNCPKEQVYVDALRWAKKHMLKHFGTLRLPLGDVQKHVRGNIVLPIGGAPEVLAATIPQDYKDGMLRTNVGESYIQLVQYSKDTIEIETINAYGSSAKPGSPHYTDQMQMFVDKKLKPMTLDKATIYRDAEKIYHPMVKKKTTEQLTTAK